MSSLRVLADVWFESFVRDSDPDADQEGREAERAARAALVTALDRVGRTAAVVERPTGGAATHLDDLWGRTESYLLVAAPDWSDATVEAVLAATRARRPDDGPHPHLILIRPAGPGGDPLREAHRRDGPRRLLVARAEWPITPAVCIRDGVETVLARPDELLTDRPVIRLVGWAPVSSVRTALSDGDGGAIVAELLEYRAPRPPQPEVVKALVGELANCAAALANAFQQREEAITAEQDAELAALSDAQHADDPTTMLTYEPEDPLAPAPTPLPQVDREALARLATRTRSRVAEAERMYPECLPLSPDDLIDALRDLLVRCEADGPDARLDIVLTGRHPITQDPLFLNQLRCAVDAGSRVRLIESVDAADFARHLGSEFAQKVERQVCSNPLLPLLVFRNTGTGIVVVGQLGSYDHGNIGFAVRSRSLADEVERAFTQSVRNGHPTSYA